MLLSMRTFALVALTSLLVASLAHSEEKPKAPVELGLVPWERNFHSASKRAKAETKPLLVLFQEVPG